MSLNELAHKIHVWSDKNGFWSNEVPVGWELMAKLLLINSEVAEALEELRNRPLDEYPMPGYQCDIITGKPEGFSVELADVLIRTLDLMYECGIDVDEVVEAKIAFNATRPYKHGKSV